MPSSGTPVAYSFDMQYGETYIVRATMVNTAGISHDFNTNGVTADNTPPEPGTLIVQEGLQYVGDNFMRLNWYPPRLVCFSVFVFV